MEFCGTHSNNSKLNVVMQGRKGLTRLTKDQRQNAAIVLGELKISAAGRKISVLTHELNSGTHGLSSEIQYVNSVTQDLSIRIQVCSTITRDLNT